MSPEKNMLEIEKDILRSPARTVVYLEGKTDLDLLFALLGITTPPGDPQVGVVYQGVLIRGLDETGSGASAVKARVELASRSRRSRILGIVDGDGRSLRELAAQFDAPHAGPLFHWKAYCIENLLAKTGWPEAWGPQPGWQDVLESYGPYVAINRVFRNLNPLLSQFRWSRHTNPSFPKPLITEAEVVDAIESDQQLAAEGWIAHQFQSEIRDFRAAVQRDLDEAHAMLNGKWLVEHMARAKTGLSIDQCRSEWVTHAIDVKGLPEVCEWWERLNGPPL